MSLTPEEIKKWNVPTTCPTCHGPLTLKDNDTKLFCDNEDCSTHFSAKFAKWINVLEADGFGPALRDYVVSLGINEISDLYDPSKKNTICSLYGSVNAQKAFDDLYKKSKNISLAKLVGGYNIGNVGEDLAQTIIDAGFDTFDKIYNITESDLLSIPGWKETRAKKFLDGFKKERDDMKYLLDKGLVTLSTITKSTPVSNILNGKKFCVTGKLEHFTRASIEAEIEKFGGIVDSGVRKGTNYLITNTPDSGSSKNEAAQRLGIKIITENDFIEMVENA